MGQLKLYGMKAAYDEIIATAVKRQHEPQQIVGDLLNAEISEKQARSIKYQMTIARLPLAKEIDEFAFEETPVNETLVRDLASGPRHGSSNQWRNPWLDPRPAAQHRADRRDRHREVPPCRQHRPILHQAWQTRLSASLSNRWRSMPQSSTSWTW